jgi:hypothetical protein
MFVWMSSLKGVVNIGVMRVPAIIITIIIVIIVVVVIIIIIYPKHVDFCHNETITTTLGRLGSLLLRCYKLPE